MIVSDVMNPTLVVLSPDERIEAAVDQLAARGVSGAPVCDRHGRVLGIVSKGDLAEALVGDRQARPEHVARVMAVDVLKLHANDDLLAAAQRMVFEGAHRAVVVDDGDEVIGVLTPLDVLAAMLRVGATRAVTAPATT